MKQEKINYQDVIDLGFERQDESDPVFFKQNGYDWFIVTLEVSKKLYFDWDSESKTVQMIRTSKDENIKARYLVRNLDELKILVKFFTESDDHNPVNAHLFENAEDSYPVYT